jgi:MFS family permease
MTAASIALNVAEVMGSFIGAILFDSSGEGSVFWFLAGASVLNQVILVAIMSMLKASPEFSPVPPNALADLDPQTRRERGLARLWNLCKSPRLACAIILIFTAALVKGSVEEMLPFHADHQWGYQPLMIGQLFSTIAIAYIISAALCGQVWQYLRNYRVVFSATWLFVLGITGWCVFIIATFNKNESVLFTGLLMYGVCLGLTHTPAALLLADAIEHEEDPNCKEAVNGIWNTMWELGGSVGFLLGGLLADHYREQMQLMAGYAVVCTMSSLLMVSVTKWSMPSGGIFKGNAKPEIAYGAA